MTKLSLRFLIYIFIPSYFRSLVAVTFRFTVLYKVNLSHTLLIINGRNSVFGQENKWQICDYLKKINFSCRKFFQLHLYLLLQALMINLKAGEPIATSLLFSTTSNCSQIFRRFSAVFQLRWISHIFNLNDCNYRTATPWLFIYLWELAFHWFDWLY